MTPVVEEAFVTEDVADRGLGDDDAGEARWGEEGEGWSVVHAAIVRRSSELINVDYRQLVARVRLDAQQAADRLGVKVETLYAYVSRGLLMSERSRDGRRSTFSAADVERLALRGRPRRSTRGPAIDVSIRTSLTSIDGRTLRFRGHDAIGLVGRTAFEQVAELLWNGRLPSHVPHWGDGRVLPFRPPDAAMLDRLRLAVALDACGHEHGATLDATGGADLLHAGPTLIATMVGALPVRSRRPTPLLRTDDGRATRGSTAGRLAVRLVAGRPSSALVAALDAALVLLADHEMAASTFAARVAASVRADAHAVVSAGMGPIAGALHGQASRSVRSLLDDAEATSVVAAVTRAADRPGPLPGTGHGLYPYGDPRAPVLMERVRVSGGRPERMHTVFAVVAEIERRGLGRPNVDMALGALGHVWAMAPDAGEALFAVARTVGWLAHGAEEWEHRPLRFRTRATYVGVAP